MILNLSILIGLAVLWLGLLGFVIPFNAGAMSAPSLFALLVLPPMLFALGIACWRSWKTKREAAKQQADVDAQAKAQADRVAQARQTHDAELHERQHFAECRAVWANVVAESMPAWCDTAPAQALWTQGAPIAEVSERTAAIAEALSETLASAITETPALAWLPLYVLPGQGQDGRALLEQVRLSLHDALIEAGHDEAATTACKFLPGNGSLNDRVIALLRNDPTQPGLLLLACDSPLAEQPDEDEFEPLDPQQVELQRWHGKPGQAVVLQLFTRAGLAAPVVTADTTSDEADPYQPYWERDHGRKDDASGWGRVPGQYRAGLTDLPPIARIHLSRELYSDSALPTGNKLSQQLRATVEGALINACLRPLPFDPAESGDDRSHTLAWLAHNCGGVDVGGSRLAAVATVLSYFESELNPINDASNVVTEFGDVGGARSALLNAIAITQAAQLQQPVLIAEFDGETRIVSGVVSHALPEEQTT
ncbi:hypothetical protein [Jeongeupia chitinilytica]|uniref:DUF2875 domain-containing protein n=1 Tax=Jeongeupia chitinilytica TaxID=1041641 RepID=A0ABQ3GX25_9NEIS|nr:hypothetical protein [Jeongeupia chitinilytica]GHD57829.1 hypothetical protein GCM10007350_06720 [Jeongeupia chitinilytica]